MIAILEPVSGCGDSNTTVSVVLHNYGSNPLTNVPVIIDVAGATPASITANYTGGVTLGEVDTFTVGTINTAMGPIHCL